MKAEIIADKLNKNQIVYIRDDYEEMVIKIIPNERDYSVFAKFKNQTEYGIDRTSKLVFEIEQNGNEISKEEYENY